ncbi:unnamed protein product, partial [Porites lobata]
LSVHTSSNNDENGKKRIPDDWQPRSNIKKLFEQGKLSINASDAITEFFSKFIVDEKLVKNYIEHLSQLQSVNEIRKQERRKEKQVRALKDSPSWTNTLSIINLARTERKSTKSSESHVSVGEDSDESDRDNDLVLCDESESESESDDDSHTVTIQEGTSTRSGRRVGHWSTRYADFVQ